MHFSRHKATSRAEIGEICELLCERLDGAGIPANAAMLAECAERGKASIVPRQTRE
jgi:hypothetical protein